MNLDPILRYRVPLQGCRHYWSLRSRKVAFLLPKYKEQ